MAMKQIGYVAKVEDGMARIRVERESACGGNCAGCHGCPQNAVLVSCPDNHDMPFRIGEKVQVIMPTSRFFAGLFQSYGVFIVTMLVGAILGYLLVGKEIASVLGGFAGLILGGLLVCFFGKYFGNDITVLRIEDNERVTEE